MTLPNETIWGYGAPHGLPRAVRAVRAGARRAARGQRRDRGVGVLLRARPAPRPPAEGGRGRGVDDREAHHRRAPPAHDAKPAHPARRGEAAPPRPHLRRPLDRGRWPKDDGLAAQARRRPRADDGRAGRGGRRAGARPRRLSRRRGVRLPARVAPACSTSTTPRAATSRTSCASTATTRRSCTPTTSMPRAWPRAT